MTKFIFPRYFGRLGSLAVLLVVLLLAAPAHAQTNVLASATPLYLQPPADASATPTSTSYDYWWPFPAYSLTPMSTSPSPSPASYETMSMTSLNYTLTISSPIYPTGNFSISGVLIANSTCATSATSTPSTSSHSIIHLTAMTSSEPVPYTADHPFKLVYLAPVFAILGLVSGATVTGMLYGRLSRYCDRRSGVGVESFDPRDLRTRSVLLERGQAHIRAEGDEVHERSGSESDEEEGEKTPLFGSANPNCAGQNPRSPNRIQPRLSRNVTAQSSPIMTGASDYGLTPESTALFQRPDQNPLSWRPWYDRLPILTAQASSPTSFTRGQNNQAARTPAGDTAMPRGFLDVPLSPASEAELTETNARQSHASIRQKMAGKLRSGTRRPLKGPALGTGGVSGRKEGVAMEHDLLFVHDDGERAVRKASGTQIREQNGNALARRGASRQYTMPLAGSATNDLSVQGLRIISTAKPYAALRRHDSETYFSEQDEDGAGVQLSSHRSGSRSILFPKASIDSSTGDTSRRSSGKLRAKSRIASPSSAGSPGPTAPPTNSNGNRRKLRARAPSNSQPPSEAPDEGIRTSHHHDARSTLRLLDTPQRVLSPPAHPELFFADPVLGAYIANPDPHESSASSATTPQQHLVPRDRRRVPNRTRDREVLKNGHRGSLSKGLEDKKDHVEESSTSVSSTAPIELQAVSAFAGQLNTHRRREVVGVVDAIIRDSWSQRVDVVDGKHLPQSPAIAAARRIGIQERVRELKERERSSETGH